MILLSNGGTNSHSSIDCSDVIAVGTVDGVAIIRRQGKRWNVTHRGLRGCSVSAVTQSSDGTLFAATHGVGVARSRDQGVTWSWCNNGLEHYDLWSARAGRLCGREVVCVGALPAHVYLSEDEGESWRPLPALRRVDSAPHWSFPPPPNVGHVKDIVIDQDRLFVGIEIGGLLVSTDFGETFDEFLVEPEPIERDIHRILIHHDRPHRLVVANGIVGVVSSDDWGKTWRRNVMPPEANYPDAFLLNPKNPDEFFMAAGDGWPSHWYERGRAHGKIVRSRDAGETWERLLGGLPNGQRALFSALTIESYGHGFDLYAADTDGQVFESRDGGDHWTMIAEVPPVSKGEFYRALVKDRQKLANIDDIQLSAAAAARFATVP